MFIRLVLDLNRIQCSGRSTNPPLSPNIKYGSEYIHPGGHPLIQGERVTVEASTVSKITRG